jgi:hypothetical protein
LFLDGLLERQAGVDPISVNRKACILARKTLVLRRKTQLVPDHVHQVRRVAAIQHRKVRIQAQVFGIEPQNTVAHRMERSGPQQPRYDAAIPRFAALRQCFAYDLLRAANHFLRRTAGECQHQDAGWIHAVQHQVRRTMRQGVGFTGPGARQDEQRAGIDALVRRRTEGRGPPLRRVQRIEGAGGLSFDHGMRTDELYIYP